MAHASSPNRPVRASKFRRDVDAVKFSAFRLILFNSIVCGLEFCASAGFTYIPPLLLKAGISEQWMGITLGIGPFLGFFFVPFMGRFSDEMSASAPLGRRKPFILALCLLLFLSLALIPNFGDASVRRDDEAETSDGDSTMAASTAASPFGALFLCLSVVLFDFSSQVCFSPCEAMLSDISSRTDQSDQAFTTYSFMVSFGGCVGYFLSSIDWKSSSISIFFSSDSTQESISFSVLAILFLFSVALTLVVTRESAISGFERRKQRLLADPDVAGVEGFSRSANHRSASSSSSSSTPSSPSRDATPSFTAGSSSSSRSTSRPLSLHFLAPTAAPFAHLRRRAAQVCRSSFLPRAVSTAASVLRRLFPAAALPPVFAPLLIANFFSWSAMMALFIFYTDFVGRAVTGGDPGATPGSEEYELYDLGVRVGSQGLFLNSLVSMGFSLAMDRLMRRFPPRVLWTWSLRLFVVCSTAMLFASHVFVHFLLIAATGILYACLNALPIAIVGEYHTDQALFFGPNRNSSLAPDRAFPGEDPESADSPAPPPRGMGADMALIDSAYFLSQVFVTTSLGYVSFWTGTVYCYIVFAVITAIVSLLALRNVVFDASELGRLG